MNPVVYHWEDENEKVPYKKTEAYKKAHAKYMKYYRSVHESPSLGPLQSQRNHKWLIASAGPGPKTPPEIKKMARRAHGSFLVVRSSESTSGVKRWTKLSQSRATTKNLV